MKRTIHNGLDRLMSEVQLQKVIEGNIGYLCHSASVTRSLELGVFSMRRLFGNRLKAIFGPQHGFNTDLQDNMIESDHCVHPYFQLPVYSLYSETRIPTDSMLQEIDTIVVDLQDVGTRVYTYISTLYLLMKKCTEKQIKVVVLDRPNPIGGEQIEGNVLDLDFQSFVGMLPIPQRHSLTMGEVGLFITHFCEMDCEYEVITMNGWERSLYFDDTDLHWIPPSPNLPVVEGTIVYPGTVLFEGTTLSEGRGTTRSLEIIGDPQIDPYPFCESFSRIAEQERLKGFVLRPLVFIPTFNKHQDVLCGGFHLHVIDRKKFNSWRTSQLICRELYPLIQGTFFHTDEYEYEAKLLAIDILNGTDKVRQWVEHQGKLEELKTLEKEKHQEFIEQKKEIQLY